MQKIIVACMLGISLIPSLTSMEPQTGKKYLSPRLSIRKVQLTLANKKLKKEAKRLKRYKANLKELDPAKLWLDSQYLVTAHIKTDRYDLFCKRYGIGRWGKPSADGTRRVELPKKHRDAFAADSRVLIVKCTDGSQDSTKALANHLGLKSNN